MSHKKYVPLEHYIVVHKYLDTHSINTSTFSNVPGHEQHLKQRSPEENIHRDPVCNYLLDNIIDILSESIYLVMNFLNSREPQCLTTRRGASNINIHHDVTDLLSAVWKVTLRSTCLCCLSWPGIRIAHMRDLPVADNWMDEDGYVWYISTYRFTKLSDTQEY